MNDRRLGNSEVHQLVDLPFWGWVILLSIAGYMVWLPVETGGQIRLAGAVILGLLLLRKTSSSAFARTLFCFFGAFLTLRYFVWRTFNTISFHDFFSFAAACALYLAEAYGVVNYMLGLFVNSEPLDRESPPLPNDPESLPSVAVLVPTYNEEPDLLESTLLAAKQLRYPASKLAIYLLDDGGTVQKRDDPDPFKAAEAIERNEELRAMCERVGATYLTREKNEHAKAGNINAALPHTRGDLVLILDADHVPTVDFLERTVGLFIDDPKMFLVQTPHFLINPDPIEKNLDTFSSMPSENEMFYGRIQRGLDFWGASFFCGSAAVLRRKYLEEIGGISGITITEDAETALELHAKGYHSAYISRPMISGLAPETFTGFIVQRVRWAQGMVQIFLLKNPLRMKGLEVRQKICYITSSFFWFFSYARLAFLVAPIAFLIFGLKIYDANLTEFLAYALPHVVAAVLVSDQLFGKVRWFLISELYEMVQAVYALPGIVRVMLNPRAPSFMVTPKGEQLNQDFISPLVRPFYALFAVTLAAITMGIYRIFRVPEELDATLITLGWGVFNLLILIAAIGALYERKQRRTTTRVPTDIAAEVFARGYGIPCRISDLSTGGAGLEFEARFSRAAERILLECSGRCTLVVDNTARAETSRLPVRLLHLRRAADASVLGGCCFEAEQTHHKAEIVSLVQGDSDRWVRFLDGRKRRLGIAAGLRYFVSISLPGFRDHLLALARSLVPARVQARPIPDAAPESDPATLPLDRPDQEDATIRSMPDPSPQTDAAAKTEAFVTRGALLVALLLGFSWSSSTPVAAERSPQPGEWSYRIPLSKLIPDEGPLMLRTSSSEYTIFVPVSPRLHLHQAGLHLEFTNSISLLPHRSQITVGLNDHIIAQMKLDPKRPDSVADIRLPLHLLEPGYNRLGIRVAQHYTEDCEDPSAPELWTQVDTTLSYLSFKSTLTAVDPQLADLDELIDRKLWDDYSLEIAMPGSSARAVHLAWGSLVSQGAALRLDYKPVRIRHRFLGDAPKHPRLIRASYTPESPAPELPNDVFTQGVDGVLIGRMDELEPFISAEMLSEIRGPFLSISRMRGSPSHFALIISGRTDQQVTVAATAFAHMNFPLPDASSMVVTEIDLPELPAYSAKSAIYENGIYSFSRFGYKTKTLKGITADKIALDVWVPPDLFSAVDRHVEMRLHMAHGAGLRADSVLNVFLNGRFEQAIHLDAVDGAVFRDYRIGIPLRSFKPGLNKITFEPRMMPLITGSCEAIQTENLLLTLFDDSTITVPNASHFVRLPDFSLMTRTGFPFAVQPDGRELAVQVTDVSSETMAASWMLVAKISQVVGSPLSQAHYSFDEIDKARNIIVIGPYPRIDRTLLDAAPLVLGAVLETPYPTLVSPQPEERPLNWSQRMLRKLGSLFWLEVPDGEPELARISQRVGLGRYTAALQSESPYHRGKAAVIVTAATSQHLSRGIEALVQPAVWNSLNGDTAVWTEEEDSLRCLKAGKSFHVGQIGLTTRLEFYFSRYPWAWLIALTGLLIMLTLLTRYLLRRFRRKYHRHAR